MDKESNKVPTYKIVVIGQQRVGKTSIAKKFVDGGFDSNSQSTVDVCCLEKHINISAKNRVLLSIWDTAGQQRYNAIVPVYYRDAQAAIVVYQINSIESFLKVKKWINELKQYGKKGLIIVVVGNKIDLKSQRKVTLTEAQQYCKKEGIQFAEVSAKTGEGIHYLFQDIAEKIMNNSSESSMIFKGNRSKSRISLQYTQQKPQKSKCCG